MTSRRGFLIGCAATAGGLSLGLPFVFSRTARAATFGPLVPDPEGVIDLPEGFSYVILQTRGDAMSDGYVVPARPDGMACFEGADGTWILMRNHENDDMGGAYPAGEAPAEAWDPDSFGGVSRVVVDPASLTVRSSNLVLTGTRRNCAGGPSPWGWLSCEEDVDPNHGFVFLCDPEAETVQMPVQIPGYGRFNHEAAAIDPDTLVAYLTEDRNPGALYRFVPSDPSDPFTGQLQAMVVVGTDNFDTGGMTVSQVVSIDWVDITESNPALDTIRTEAFAAGAAEIHRGEGTWFADGTVYVCSTNGGPVEGGQIFALRDGARELELLAVSEDRELLDMPDNITVAPWGDLYMAEDGSTEQYLRILEPDGTVSDFARNAISNSELAGVCFSPDGSTLFVNIQGNGLTLAITGPFPPNVPVTPDAGVMVDAGTDGGVVDDTDDGCGCSTPGSGGSGTGAIAAAGLVAGIALRRAGRSDEG
ncbi:MAG: DUF839 domain-containing protein [Deltaproteobacteria bacterium]|nr:DUF839 domain-containing protein [Deltaproteobacteria bacterium]